MTTPQALKVFLGALAELHERHGLEWDESLYKPADDWELAAMEDTASRIPLVINVEGGRLQHASNVREASCAASLTIYQWPDTLAAEHPNFLRELAGLIDAHADSISAVVNASTGYYHPGRKYDVGDREDHYQAGLWSRDGRISYHRFFEILSEAGIPVFVSAGNDDNNYYQLDLFTDNSHAYNIGRHNGNRVTIYSEDNPLVTVEGSPGSLVGTSYSSPRAAGIFAELQAAGLPEAAAITLMREAASHDGLDQDNHPLHTYNNGQDYALEDEGPYSPEAGYGALDIERLNDLAARFLQYVQVRGGAEPESISQWQLPISGELETIAHHGRDYYAYRIPVNEDSFLTRATFELYYPDGERPLPEDRDRPALLVLYPNGEEVPMRPGYDDDATPATSQFVGRVNAGEEIVLLSATPLSFEEGDSSVWDFIFGPDPAPQVTLRGAAVEPGGMLTLLEEFLQIREAGAPARQAGIAETGEEPARTPPDARPASAAPGRAVP